MKTSFVLNQLGFSLVIFYLGVCDEYARLFRLTISIILIQALCTPSALSIAFYGSSYTIKWSDALAARNLVRFCQCTKLTGNHSIIKMENHEICRFNQSSFLRGFVIYSLMRFAASKETLFQKPTDNLFEREKICVCP